jgi:hypothetical protein
MPRRKGFYKNVRHGMSHTDMGKRPKGTSLARPQP